MFHGRILPDEEAFDEGRWWRDALCDLHHNNLLFAASIRTYEWANMMPVERMKDKFLRNMFKVHGVPKECFRLFG
jgi:hypothetical protein